jgi:hypothetical protein
MDFNTFAIAGPNTVTTSIFYNLAGSVSTTTAGENLRNRPFMTSHHDIFIVINEFFFQFYLRIILKRKCKLQKAMQFRQVFSIYCKLVESVQLEFC